MITDSYIANIEKLNLKKQTWNIQNKNYHQQIGTNFSNKYFCTAYNNSTYEPIIEANSAV